MKSCDYSSLQFLPGVYWSLILRLPFSYYEERMCDCRGTAGLEGNGQGGLRYHKPEGTVRASNSDPLNKASKPSIILTTDRPTKSHAGSIPLPLVVHSRIGIVRDMVNLDPKRDLTVLKSRSLRTGRARSRGHRGHVRSISLALHYGRTHGQI